MQYMSTICFSAKPSVSRAIKDTIEVKVGESADFKCPITDDGEYSGKIEGT